MKKVGSDLSFTRAGGFMKLKLLNCLFIIFIYLACVPVYAQSNFKDGKYTVNKNVYTIINMNDYRIKSVVVQDNREYIEKLIKDKRGLADIVGFKFANGETVTSAFVKVFGRRRIIELSKENAMAVDIYPDYTGKIVAVDFLITPDSKITMEEFDKFVVYLKKHISIVFLSEVSSEYKIPSIGQAIHFKRILDTEDKMLGH